MPNRIGEPISPRLPETGTGEVVGPAPGGTGATVPGVEDRVAGPAGAGPARFSAPLSPSSMDWAAGQSGVGVGLGPQLIQAQLTVTGSPGRDTPVDRTTLQGIDRGQLWESGQLDLSPLLAAVPVENQAEVRTRLGTLEAAVNTGRAELEAELLRAYEGPLSDVPEEERGLPLNDAELRWLADDPESQGVLERVLNRATWAATYDKRSGDPAMDGVSTDEIEHTDDYTADEFFGPLELAIRGEGDCEDGCMLAAFTLEMMGFPADRVNLTIVEAGTTTSSGRVENGHVVTTLSTHDDRPPYVLDPLPFQSYDVTGSRIKRQARPNTVRRADRTSYTPIAALTHQGQVLDIVERAERPQRRDGEPRPEYRLRLDAWKSSRDRWETFPASDPQRVEYQRAGRTLNVRDELRIWTEIRSDYAALGPPPAVNP
ncbi:MAG: hypothetical protein AAFX94_13940, partial [Myxococcota bacterium]